MLLSEFEKEILNYLGEKAFRKVRSVRIGIAGAGGLGSNAAANLVRSGFMKFTIIDFDIVDYTNMNRQFYFSDQVGLRKVDALKENLERINPDIEIRIVDHKVEVGNIWDMFDDCDVVIEAFDRAEYKSMLVEKLLPTGKFIVAASGLAGIGNTDKIQVHHIRKNLVVVGDLESDVKDMPPMAPRVNIAAAKQADIVLEYVLARG